ncbi:helix-turn-helix domain-containing protein [Pseudonocardia sichuanensis]
MTSGPAGPTYPIESVRNALLLVLLLRDRKRLRVSECAAELGVAWSTAHRLLAMLEHYGFLQRDAASRTYLAGEALLALGLAGVNRLDIRARGQAHDGGAPRPGRRDRRPPPTGGPRTSASSAPWRPPGNAGGAPQVGDGLHHPFALLHAQRGGGLVQ